jgi:hypothetical protein
MNNKTKSIGGGAINFITEKKNYEQTYFCRFYSANYIDYYFNVAKHVRINSNICI